ncbi:MAG: 30S ribosomal protein S13 [Candidatus Micrarchaeaceae archaeon]
MEKHDHEHKEVQKRGEVASIIRLAGRDIDGSLNMPRALSKIKGIGFNLSNALSIAIERKLGIARSTTLGSLSEQQIAEVEKIIKDPYSVGIPEFMLNHNNDMETGAHKHYVGSDLIFATRQDINRDVSLKAWRGFRHQYGQKVRGQHSRSTGRTGATVGVTKKAIVTAQKEAKAASAEQKQK